VVFDARWQPVWRILARGLRLRCPHCGRERLFVSGFRMHERCATCGLRYEREQGFFVGAIYVNYAITVVIVLGGVLLLDRVVGLTLGQQLGLGITLAALVPLAFFRYARSLWLSVTYAVTGRGERAPQRGRRPPSR
jgi:uncharacterized protein (DUF983 family)